MRRLLVTTAMLTALAHLGVPVLEACGAKFLVATRAPRFQRLQHATNPAKILVYQHDTEAGVVEFMAKLEETLNGVGHTVTLVSSEEALQQTARGGDFNIVMMELETARRLRASVESWSPEAAVLPMVAFATRPEAAQAKQEFGQVLTLPAKTSQLFSTVQDAYQN